MKFERQNKISQLLNDRKIDNQTKLTLTTHSTTAQQHNSTKDSSRETDDTKDKSAAASGSSSMAEDDFKFFGRVALMGQRWSVVSVG